MILALVVLLVVATVSGLILGAAYVSAGKIKRSQESQQQYLAVSSAAEMLKKSFEDGSYSFVLQSGIPWSSIASDANTSYEFTITTSLSEIPVVNGTIQWDSQESAFGIYLYILDGNTKVYPIELVVEAETNKSPGNSVTIEQKAP